MDYHSGNRVATHPEAGMLGRDNVRLGDATHIHIPESGVCLSFGFKNPDDAGAPAFKNDAKREAGGM
jgi:hypothetical protein